MRRRNPKVLVLDGEVVGRPSEVDCMNHNRIECINEERFNADTDKMKLHVLIYDFLLRCLPISSNFSPVARLLSLCGPELEGHHTLWMEAIERHKMRCVTPAFIERSSEVIKKNHLIDKAVKCKATLIEGSVEDYIGYGFNCLDLDYCGNFKSMAKFLFSSLNRNLMPPSLTIHVTSGYRGKDKDGGNGVTAEERDDIMHRLDKLMYRKFYTKGSAWEEPTKETLDEESGKKGQAMRCFCRSYHRNYARIARELS